MCRPQAPIATPVPTTCSSKQTNFSPEVFVKMDHFQPKMDQKCWVDTQKRPVSYYSPKEEPCDCSSVALPRALKRGEADGGI